MSERKPLEQTRHLFAALARVQALEREADAKGKPGLLLRALAILDEHAYDARWHGELAAKYSARGRSFQERSHGSRDEAQAKWAVDTPLHIRVERARETDEPLLLANEYVRQGLYRDALMAYNASDHRLECVSNLNILQGNWAMVHVNLGKAGPLETLSNVLLLNLAFAHWSVGHYGEALAVALRLDPDKEIFSAWLSTPEILGILLVGAIISLDRSTLKYFFYSDPVLHALNSEHQSRLVDAVLHIDNELFWSELERLHIPMVSETVAASEEPRVLARDRIEKDWLSIHNKLKLSTVLETFKAGRDDAYNVLDLVEDLRRWEAPYRVNTVRGTVELYEPVTDNTSAATELARWYKRDALVLCHARARSDDYFTTR